MDPTVKITNPTGTFALYESGRAEQIEIERYDDLEEAKFNLNLMLGADPVNLYVIDLAGRREAYRVVWQGQAPQAAAPAETVSAPEAAPEAVPAVAPEADAK